MHIILLNWHFIALHWQCAAYCGEVHGPKVYCTRINTRMMFRLMVMLLFALMLMMMLTITLVTNRQLCDQSLGIWSSTRPNTPHTAQCLRSCTFTRYRKVLSSHSGHYFTASTEHYTQLSTVYATHRKKYTPCQLPQHPAHCISMMHNTLCRYSVWHCTLFTPVQCTLHAYWTQENAPSKVVQKCKTQAQAWACVLKTLKT